MDVLALSDRRLRGGASDRLLQLLVERGEENHSATDLPHSYGIHSVWSNSWQHFLRLKDKQLAARLALKYLHRWELNAAMDVLTMCICHLPQSDPLRSEFECVCVMVTMSYDGMVDTINKRKIEKWHGTHCPMMVLDTRSLRWVCHNQTFQALPPHGSWNLVQLMVGIEIGMMVGKMRNQQHPTDP